MSSKKKLELREVTAETWRDFEALFEAKGGPKYCWCMAWRATNAELKDTSSKARKKQMKLRVFDEEVPVGILGYLDRVPVAWCSIAPRDTYRTSLGGPRGDDDDVPPERVWSLACMFIARDHRGEGRAEELVRGAMKHAKKKGARVLEVYPVDEGSPSYRFMGFVPMFERLGFEEVGREGTRRHVMRRSLSRVR